MLAESDRQLAALAVSRYGAEEGPVLETLAAVRRARALGRPTDFLDALVARKLISDSQARRLRYALDDTHLDPQLEQPGPSPSPASAEQPDEVPRDAEDLIGPASGLDLRAIGPYRLLAQLGAGGMGSVYRAYHEAEDRTVALKVLADPLARNQDYLERFRREAQSVARLNHPNIVRSLGAGHDPKTNKHYLVLEYVDGMSAQDLLERRGRLTVGDAVHITLDVARALEHAHSRRIIHRDIKPDNILLTTSGVAKLSDLGLAKVMGELSSLTGTRQTFGTPFYMPYEQAYNARTADGRSDIFALGATLYHLVTGEVPFSGDSALEIMDKKKVGDYPTARSLCPDVPVELDRILAKMLARYPRDRYRLVSDLIVDLERSSLSAAVPSFVDPEVALQDPLMRSRLTSPPQPTRLDLSTPSVKSEESNGSTGVWYLRYRTRAGRLVKGRLAQDEVLARLAQGRLHLQVKASREPKGEYRPLAAYPEFQEVVRALQARSRERERPDEAPSPDATARLTPASGRLDAGRAEATPTAQDSFLTRWWRWLAGPKAESNEQ